MPEDPTTTTPATATASPAVTGPDTTAVPGAASGPGW